MEVTGPVVLIINARRAAIKTGPVEDPTSCLVEIIRALIITGLVRELADPEEDREIILVIIYINRQLMVTPE